MNKICCFLNNSCISPRRLTVEALAHIIHPLAEQYVFALLKLQYSAHFCHCCSIYDEPLVRGESSANLLAFITCWLVGAVLSGSFTYLHTRLCLLHLRLLAEQYVFASAQAAYLCFRSVGSSKGPRPVSTSHRQSVRSSWGKGLHRKMRDSTRRANQLAIAS